MRSRRTGGLGEYMEQDFEDEDSPRPDAGYSIQRRPWFYQRHDAKEGPSWHELRASLEVIKLYLRKRREGDDSPQDYALLYRQGIARSDRDPRYRLDSF